MNFDKHLMMASIALVMSALWGVFADLRQGQPEWFLIRIVAVTVITYVGSRWLDRKP